MLHNLKQFISNEKSDSTKIMIVLTDGMNNATGATLAAVTQAAVQNDIIIYTIGLGSQLDLNALNSLADLTGGNYYHASNASQLYGIFDKLEYEVDLYKDTDTDGLSDYHEKKIVTGQLKMGNGAPMQSFALMDYQNPDSDGDGLLDGEEIKIKRQTVAGKDVYYTVMASSPTIVDSDGDGYPDDVDLFPLEYYHPPVLFIPDSKPGEYGITTDKDGKITSVASGSTFTAKIASELKSEGYKLNKNMHISKKKASASDISSYVISYIKYYDYSYPTKAARDSYDLDLIIIDNKVEIKEGVKFKSPGKGGIDYVTQSGNGKYVSKIISLNTNKLSKPPVVDNPYAVEYYRLTSDDVNAARITDINRFILPNKPAAEGEYRKINGKTISKDLSFFSGSPTIESPAIRDLSIEAAMLAYDDYHWLRSEKPALLHKMLEELGFTNIQSQNYCDGYINGSTLTTQNNISLTLATKKISEGGKTFNLIAVILRGTDYDEWQGNFRVWLVNGYSSRNHYSFDSGASTVTSALYYYTQGMDKSTIKFWITGHSRGAAVANLAAVKLADDYLYSKESIYAYTFATPNVRLPYDNTDKTRMKDDYQYIHNYVNTEDFVTQVPLEKWGYTKYGVTKSFTSTVEYKSYSMSDLYRSTGLTRFDVDADACANGISAFYTAAKDVDEYYNKKHNSPFAYNTMYEMAYNVIAVGAMGNLGLFGGWGSAITDGTFRAVILFFKDNQESTILYAHTPQTYYAYTCR